MVWSNFKRIHLGKVVRGGGGGRRGGGGWGYAEEGRGPGGRVG